MRARGSWPEIITWMDVVLQPPKHVAGLPTAKERHEATCVSPYTKHTVGVFVPPSTYPTQLCVVNTYLVPGIFRVTAQFYPAPNRRDITKCMSPVHVPCLLHMSRGTALHCTKSTRAYKVHVSCTCSLSPMSRGNTAVDTRSLRLVLHRGDFTNAPNTTRHAHWQPTNVWSVPLVRGRPHRLASGSP